MWISWRRYCVRCVRNWRRASDSVNSPTKRLIRVVVRTRRKSRGSRCSWARTRRTSSLKGVLVKLPPVRWSRCELSWPLRRDRSVDHIRNDLRFLKIFSQRSLWLHQVRNDSHNTNYYYYYYYYYYTTTTTNNNNNNNYKALIRVQTHAAFLHTNPNLTITLTFDLLTKYHVTSRMSIPRSFLYQVWTLSNHSFLSYAPNVHFWPCDLDLWPFNPKSHVTSIGHPRFENFRSLFWVKLQTNKQTDGASKVL